MFVLLFTYVVFVFSFRRRKMPLAPRHQRSQLLQKPRDAEWVRIRFVCCFSVLEYDHYYAFEKKNSF